MQEMESGEVLTGYSFRCMQNLIVPEDWAKVTQLLMKPGTEVSVAKLQDVSDMVSRRRWLTWCLLHPELDSRFMHPSRSVFSRLCPALCLF